MKKLLWLIALLIAVDGLILFFFWEDLTPEWKPESAVLVDLGPAPEETKTLVEIGPVPMAPTIIRIVFFVCLALIVVGVISLGVILVYRLWSRCSTRGKYLCMVWLIIIAFVLIGLFPPVYRPKQGVRWGGQNTFAFLFDIPTGYRINYRTLLVEWAIAFAIPIGVITTLRIKNRPS